MNTAWPHFVGVFETRFDADESLKKIEHKIKALQESPSPLRGQNKVGKYENQKAKLLYQKRGAELFDRDWAEICAVFAMRIGELHGKDRKFDSKAKNILADFTLQLTQACQIQAKGKQKARRFLPQSKKDYE